MEREKKTYAQIFEEAFPYYLAMGMTYEQFWEQDSELVKYYRKANEIRQEQINQEAWLHGMYIYEAIADLAPILRSFGKKGSRARQYPDKPYEFKKPEINRKISRKDAEAKAKSDKIRERMFAMMKMVNKENAEKRIRASFNAIGTAHNIKEETKAAAEKRTAEEER